MPDLNVLDSFIHYEDSAPEDQPDAVAASISAWADRKGLR